MSRLGSFSYPCGSSQTNVQLGDLKVFYIDDQMTPQWSFTASSIDLYLWREDGIFKNLPNAKVHQFLSKDSDPHFSWTIGSGLDSSWDFSETDIGPVYYWQICPGGSLTDCATSCFFRVVAKAGQVSTVPVTQPAQTQTRTQVFTQTQQQQTITITPTVTSSPSTSPSTSAPPTTSSSLPTASPTSAFVTSQSSGTVPDVPAPISAFSTTPSGTISTTAPAIDNSATQDAQADPTISATGTPAPASGGLGTNAKIGIGVGVGVGVPILAALVALLVVTMMKRRKPDTPKAWL